MFWAFFSTLPRNFVRVWHPRYLPWHLLAIVATYILVTSGLDWWYFTHTRLPYLFELTLPAAILGFFVPIVLPVALYTWGEWGKHRKLSLMAGAVAGAEALGWVVSSLYKAFTGRIQPEFFTNLGTTDLSHQFNFGFWQHGIFWGWPSSHTAVAFAGMVALICFLYPKHKILSGAALLYALYIGLGVSVSIHWFSDFAAGAILGTLIGIIVASAVRGRT